MYELPASLLYANGLNRYLINSPMLPNLKRDPDGSLTLHLQNEAPPAERQSIGFLYLQAPSGRSCGSTRPRKLRSTERGSSR